MGLTEQQLAERQQGLGGSDAAPALGLSPYKSALELFMEKREPRTASSATLAAFRWGTLLEPVIRQEYAEMTGRKVMVPTGILRHASHHWMTAHLDGVTDDARVFEAKTARSADGWGKSGSDEVPHHYLIQVQHYLAITGFAVADVAVLISGNDFRIYEVPADRELQAMIIDGEHDFWQHVQKGEPPAPDFERADAHELVKRLYPGTDGRTVIATEDDERLRKVFIEAGETARQYQQLADKAKAELLAAMAGASRLQFPGDGIELRRREITRKEHLIPATSYIDALFTKIKETA